MFKTSKKTHLYAGRRHAGFSLAELLLTLAILLILAAVAIPNVVAIRRNMRQKELDAKAEMIYIAAQNQLIKLRSSGNEAAYLNGHSLGGSLHFISSDDSAGDPQKVRLAVMPSDAADASLLDHLWIIEYNPDSAGVHAVFYCEKNDWGCVYPGDTFEDWRTLDNRLGDEVGYYDGTSASSSSESKYNLEPELVSKCNREKLALLLQCRNPLYSDPGRRSEADQMFFTVILEDGFGHSVTNYYSPHDYAGDMREGVPSSVRHGNGFGYQMKFENGTFKLALILDDLTSVKTRFNKLYPELVPGKLTVTAYVTSTARNVFGNDGKPGTYLKWETNSLFADESTPDTALIAYGRHLQNLDDSSGVTGIKNAVQTQPISFADTDIPDPVDPFQISNTNDFADWFDCYNCPIRGYFNNPAGVSSLLPLFRPIENAALLCYDGDRKSITGLNVDAILDAGSGKFAGVFAQVAENAALENVTLQSAAVKGVDSAAALLAGAGSGVKITNCTVEGSTVASTGGSAGALVGSASGSLTVADCAVTAAKGTKDMLTTVVGVNGVGGIVGSVSGDGSGLNVERCIVTGTKIGVKDDGSVSAGDAGGVAGRVSGSAAIQSCGVYLTASDRQGRISSEAWIAGTNSAGGLIGTAAGGATIEKSFASTVLRGGTAGGLIGSAAGGKVTLSYADSYIYGAHTGGLMGGGGIGTLENCYAAGFQYASVSAAGLVNGTAAKMASSYTICDMHDASGGSVSNCCATARVADEAADVYYAMSSTGGEPAFGTQITNETKEGNLQSKVGGAFRNSDTLDETLTYWQPLRIYDYPHLKELPKHYGDWKAEFKTGSLAYYEYYGGDSYGVMGDTLDTLLSGRAVLGDGYGVLYAEGSQPSKITVKLGKNGSPSKEIDSADASAYFTVKDSDGVTYRVYPLPTEWLNGTPDANWNGFYLRAEVNGSANYFNPHFGKTAVAVDTAPTVSAERPISVRSPRQLYCMSLYFDDHYADLTNPKKVTFLQESDLVYSHYEWAKYYGEEIKDKAQGGEVIPGYWQQPIARTKEFQSTYNGGCHIISDVSFISATPSDDKAYYIGMFGRSSGTLRDIFLVTDYDPDDAGSHVFAQWLGSEEGDGQLGIRIYAGVLAGYSTGAIDNCAVAGYYIAGANGTLIVNNFGTLYAGGIVGINAGTIKNCSADCPTMNLSVFNSYAYAGGFVGSNSGGITNSYALGYIHVVDCQGTSKVNIAGFAGLSTGYERDCYCAVSLLASGNGTTSYGFAPIGGLAPNCYYLDKGTYSYIGVPYSYNFNDGNTKGDPTDLLSLRNMSGARADAEHSLHHPNTAQDDPSAAYPFRAVVAEAGGAAVHFGDWLDGAVLGTLGVFYWEHEEHGSNNGFHFSFVGVEEGKALAGSTLCTAHDDGGVITEYGYGYYVLSGQASHIIKHELDGLAVSVDKTDLDAGKPGTKYHADAAISLNEQLKGYTFFPYVTRAQSESNGGSWLYLSSKTKPDGEWKITYNPAEGSPASSELVYTFRISPFFADALQLSGIKNAGADVKLGELKPKTSNGSTTDYSKEAGSEKNTYEIRSMQQLQYINWNWDSGNTSTRVTKNNYQKYTYLVYTKNSGKDTRAGAGNSARADLRWVQTHDTDGSSLGNNYTPIAGSAIGTNTSDANTRLYAWFGGTYDGQSYKLQNLNIVSDCYTVGVFGVTVGANLKNIILYSNKGSTIKRETPEASKTNRLTGFYAIGGLVGIAYDYTTGSSAGNTIENCAIAGYTLIDASTNQQGRGHGSIGGLIGLAYVNLERCSAVTDIRVACMHINGCMIYGSYVHAGGLAGVSKYNITNCYTGGSITVAEQSINEFFTGGDKDNPTYLDLGIAENAAAVAEKQYDRNLNTHIYAGGFSGGVYSCNFTNFDGTEDGKPVFTNCYTYVSLPTLRGTIKGVSLIGTVADRYGKGNAGITIKNCYYLQSVKDVLSYDSIQQPKYCFKDLASQEDPQNKPHIITEAEWEDMLLGDTRVNRKIVSKDNANPSFKIELTGVTYEQLSSRNGFDATVSTYTGTNSWPNFAVMPTETQKTFDSMTGALGGKPTWDWVTVTEGHNASVNGKYSFPGNNTALQGQNYPFPTVIRQTELTYHKVVNIHYGEWPQDGFYWADGIGSLDLFADMVLDPGDIENYLYAVKTFKLYDKKNELGGASLSAGDFKFSSDGCAEIVGDSFEARWDSAVGMNCYDIPVKALKDDAIRVSMSKKLGDGEDAKTVTASFILNVTHKLTLTSEPEKLLLYALDSNAESGKIALSAKSSDGAKDFSSLPGASWTLKGASDSYSITPANDAAKRVVSPEPGSHSLEATFTFDYHSDAGGKEYSETFYVPEFTFGKLGLGVGTELSGYREVWRTDVGSDHQGSSPEGLAYDDTNRPQPPQGADFFLYETASDKLFGELFDGKSSSLKDLTITSISLKPDGGDAVPLTDDGSGVYTGGNYTLTLEPVESDGYFDYRAGTLLCNGGAAPAKVDLTISATHTPAELEESYQFTVTVTSVPAFRVAFDAGDVAATGSMRSAGVAVRDGEDYVLTLPDCLFSKAGWHFAGWAVNTAAAGEPPVFQEVNGSGKTLRIKLPTTPGGAVTLTPEDGGAFEVKPPENGSLFTLTSKWEPNTYVVKFDLNTPGGIDADAEDFTPEPLTLTRDLSSFDLPKPSDEFVNRLNRYFFASWNTEADGSGKMYNAGTNDRHLTDKDGETVDLFAQWASSLKLKLVSAHYSDATGEKSYYAEGGSLPGYEAPVWDDGDAGAWTLEGWYTSKGGDGVKVLDGEGNIVAAVDGYTAGSEGDFSFLLDQDRALYPKWTLSAFIPATSNLEAGRCYVLLDKNGYLVDETDPNALNTASDKERPDSVGRTLAETGSGALIPGGTSYEKYLSPAKAPGSAVWEAASSGEAFTLINGNEHYLYQRGATVRTYASAKSGYTDFHNAAGNPAAILDNENRYIYWNGSESKYKFDNGKAGETQLLVLTDFAAFEP